MCLPITPEHRFQLIPARGRKHWYDCIVVIFDRFQLIPARGRKLERLGITLLHWQFQLIPARGRKHDVFRDINLLHGFQLIPARGRKLAADCTFCSGARISTYPRKGTETHPSPGTSVWSDISTYPRKGTKNSASKKMRSFSFANLNSLFSVGYSSMNRAAAAFSLPWLLYCDKMCYNRANSKHLLQNTQTHFLFIVQFFHNL